MDKGKQKKMLEFRDAAEATKWGRDRLLDLFDNERLIQHNYFRTITVEDSASDLNQNPQMDVVLAFTPLPEMAGSDGYLSPGSLSILTDNGTTMLITSIDPTFRNNVTLSLDLKRVAPIPVGKKLLLRCKTTVYNNAFCTVIFEILGEDRKLLSVGSHTKVFLPGFNEKL